MLVSAELRWFWKGAIPREINEWFRSGSCPPGEAPMPFDCGFGVDACVLLAVAHRSVMQTGVAAGAPPQAMLDTYCYTCHNTTVKMGGLALQGLDIQAAGADADVWEKAVRKLRGRP